jgi:hypothetical protein
MIFRRAPADFSVSPLSLPLFSPCDSHQTLFFPLFDFRLLFNYLISYLTKNVRPIVLNKSSILVVILFFSACGFDGPRSSPSTIHLSSNGRDSGPGTEAKPWATVDKANRAARAGDVIILHAGQYREGIRPSNGGKPGSPIEFRAAPGERVVLDAEIGIQLGPDAKYIVVDGFEIHASTRLADLKGCSHITIRNCKLYGGRGNYSTFSLDGASYCVIQNNYLDRQDPDTSSESGDNPGGGDGIRLVGNSHHNLIEGDTVTRCEHVGFASSFSKADVYQSYNVWRNNVAYNNHTNYSLQDGVQRCIFENNTGYYPGLVWTGGNGNCLQFTGSYCIIRFNTLYDDTGTTHTARRWPALVGTGTGSANGGEPSMQHNKIYNNTLYGETDQQEWKKAGWRIDNNSSARMRQNDNVFKNNIIARTGDVAIDDIDAVRGLDELNNRYEGNLLQGANGRHAEIRYGHLGGNDRWTLAEVKIARPRQWASSNKEGDPLFVNTKGQGPSKDFNLRPGSPAIDAGVELTVATSSGSGTSLAVADAGYFTDGWGIPGVEGDSIRIENNVPVGIIRVDYESNTISLSSPRSWAKGVRVFYYRCDRFKGNAPDIGAHESPWKGSRVGDAQPGGRSLTR